MAFYSVEVTRLFYRRGWYIQMPEEVPVMTRRGFQLIVPLLFIMLSLSLLRLWLQQQFGISLPDFMASLFRPLIVGADTLPALLITLLIAHLLWFMGIHGALIVTGLLSPFWMAGVSANQTALMAGEPLPHTFLQGFWDYYLLIGGLELPCPWCSWRCAAVATPFSRWASWVSSPPCSTSTSPCCSASPSS